MIPFLDILDKVFQDTLTDVGVAVTAVGLQGALLGTENQEHDRIKLIISVNVVQQNCISKKNNAEQTKLLQL